MFDSLSEFFLGLTWRSVLVGVLIFVGSFLVNLAIVSVILVNLPADHFSPNNKRRFASKSHPMLRPLMIVGKNVGGLLLVALGVVLSLPGVPGQGLLTILLGIMLLDFPGKRGLEYKLVSKPRVRDAINKLRRKFDKPDLILE